MYRGRLEVLLGHFRGREFIHHVILDPELNRAKRARDSTTARSRRHPIFCNYFSYMQWVFRGKGEVMDHC